MTALYNAPSWTYNTQTSTTLLDNTLVATYNYLYYDGVLRCVFCLLGYEMMGSIHYRIFHLGIFLLFPWTTLNRIALWGQLDDWFAYSQCIDYIPETGLERHLMRVDYTYTSSTCLKRQVAMMYACMRSCGGLWYGLQSARLRKGHITVLESFSCVNDECWWYGIFKLGVRNVVVTSYVLSMLCTYGSV